MKHYILENKEPKEVDYMIWAKWFETGDRVIKSDFVGDIHISTVFIGLDNTFFETMIFGGYNDLYQERYWTYSEAEQGHQKAMNIVYGSNLPNEINFEL